MNLLRETINVLTRYGYTDKSVKFVLVDGMGYSWDDFAAVAGIECSEASLGLKVSLTDGSWLERGNPADGEFWVCHHAPKARHATTVALTPEMLTG